MILVTGGAGFVGAHLIKGLRASGYDGEIVVSDPRDPFVEMNLDQLRDGYKAVFHLGAISDTTCSDRNALAENNIRLPLVLAEFCYVMKIPFIYASSASVYGNDDFPLNYYALSKHILDEKMIKAQMLKITPPYWYGLRFFNVYGSGEGHKGTQASVIWQMKHAGLRAIFVPFAQRDFIHVSDVVKVMLWFWRTLPASGIYDVGTGTPRTFREVARICRGDDFDLVPMPDKLKGRYQFNTRADLTKLRAAGYSDSFLTVEEGAKLV